MDLRGKLAVITGGGRGLGRTIAAALATAGADLVLVGRDGEALAAAARALGAGGRRVTPVAADVTREEGAEAIRAVLAGAPDARADILVTAAGTRDASGSAAQDTDLDAFRRVMEGNVVGTLLPVRAVLPFMLPGRDGRIVAISGVYGLRGRARHLAGSASKWAVEGLVRSLALELGTRGITVNAVCPGFVDGERAEAAFARMAAASGRSPAEIRGDFVARTALGRLPAPEDVAAAVLFLAGPGGRCITGQDIVVDAGWTL
jgi:3-oxoacyl-[acyl-carrier protein] reductase